MARCWRSERARRLGLRALAGAVGGVALLSLAGIAWLHTGRASLPLGHHNLLAAWLVILLPLAILPARETGGWRWLGWGSGLAGAGAVLASQSLLGIAGLAIEALAVALLLVWRHGPDRRTSGLTAGLALLLLSSGGAVASPRVWQILSGSDPSAGARAVYYRGGWEGFLARPLLGWGPGSAAWTVARFLRPRPGLNPPSEVVGELHSLPVELAYELGITGLLLASGLAAIFFVRRMAERRTASDPLLLAAGLLGLLGGGVVSLGNASLAVTALPVAAALAAGAALAGEGRNPGVPGEFRGQATPPPASGGIWGGLPPAPFPSPPRRLPLRSGDRRADFPGSPEPARPSGRSRSRLSPLPGAARLAASGGRAGSGGRSLPCGRRSRPPEWDRCGSPPESWGWASTGPGPRGHLPRPAPSIRSPRSPPTSSPSPAPRSPDAPSNAAHALFAEPRLLAAPFWEVHGRLRSAALREAASREGIDSGWRAALVTAAGRLLRGPLEAPNEPGWLALEIDQTPSLSLSLYAFRRPPWPLEWPLVEVRPAALAVLDLPPASALETSSAAAFRCLPLSGPDLHRACGKPCG